MHAKILVLCVFWQSWSGNNSDYKIQETDNLSSCFEEGSFGFNPFPKTYIATTSPCFFFLISVLYTEGITNDVSAVSSEFVSRNVVLSGLSLEILLLMTALFILDQYRLTLLCYKFQFNFFFSPIFAQKKYYGTKMGGGTTKMKIPF
jgi:hypothetical protein